MVSSSSVIAAPALPSVADGAARVYLRSRMAGPQRHRLLHAYPLAAAMPRCPENRPVEVVHDPAAGRGLLVGVLPHPFCNPAVTGCGFCTFPHQPGNSAKTTSVVEAVIGEINRIIDGQLMDLFSASVLALYFGGGTANLTEPAAFRDL